MHGALVRALALVTGVAWLAVELRQSAVTRRGADREDRGSRLVLAGGIGVGVVLAVLAGHLAPDLAIRPPWLRGWLGLGLLWCGVGLRWWSFQTLGGYFTFTVQTSPDQPVIATGPYRVVRHPSYAGLLLAVAGVGCLLGNWLGLVVLVVASSCGIVYRIHVEEGALTRSLGDDYRDYARRHKRLVPYVW